MHALQHLDLLLRYDRTFNLRTAVERATTKGARVLDAGCGAGLLSLWAAKAGASEVVAVDLEGTELAASLAAENGLANHIRFLEGDLWQLELDDGDGFDLIMAMIYLNDPRRDERQTELAYFLRDRYLRPGGTMIPQRVRYVVRACEWPAQDWPTRVERVHGKIADLEGRYGFRFQSLGRAVASRPWLPWFPMRDSDGRLPFEAARFLSSPSIFCEIDYGGAQRPYPELVEMAIASPGHLNCLIWTQELWFESQLLFANESITWVATPRTVHPGERVTVRLGRQWREQNLVELVTEA